MAQLSPALSARYASAQDALEDLCDTLVVETKYAHLSAHRQLAFHDWAFAHAEDYLGGGGVDWVDLLHDWYDHVQP